MCPVCAHTRAACRVWRRVNNRKPPPPYSAAPFLTRVPHPRRRPLDAHEFGPAQYMNSTSTNHPITLLLTRPSADGHLIGSDPKTVRVSTPRCISVKLDRRIPLHPPADTLPRQNHTSSTHKSVHTIYSHCWGFVVVVSTSSSSSATAAGDVFIFCRRV